MKALLYVGAGGVVREWYAEDGTFDVATLDGIVLGDSLAAWLGYGWKIHGGFSTALNGLTCVILRDGKAFWVDKESPHA